MAWFLVYVCVFLAFFPAMPELWYSPGAPWWTALTYQFTHGGWVHLIVNMVALASFGPAVERRISPVLLLVAFLACGVVGAWAMALMGPHGPLTGASASILGLFVIYCSFKPHARIMTPLIVPMPAWLVLALYVLFSIAAWAFDWLPQISHAAHLGGMAMGLLMGEWKKKNPGHR